MLTFIGNSFYFYTAKLIKFNGLTILVIMHKHLLHINHLLFTQRLVIRRFKEEDGEALFRLVQNNRYRLESRFTYLLDAVHSEDEATFYIYQTISDWLLQQKYVFAIWENDSAQMVGYIELFNLDLKVPRGEVIFFMDEKFTGRELMTEALLEFCKFCFEEMKIVKLNFITATDNYAAQRVARKCGFRREGDIRMHFKRDSGDLIDALLLGLSSYDQMKV